jgi:PAS domain S-box-containing protein
MFSFSSLFTTKSKNNGPGRRFSVKLKIFSSRKDKRVDGQPDKIKGEDVETRESRSSCLVSVDEAGIQKTEPVSRESSKRSSLTIKEYVFGKNLSILPIDFLFNKQSNLKVDPQIYEEFLKQKPERPYSPSEDTARPRFSDDPMDKNGEGEQQEEEVIEDVTVTLPSNAADSLDPPSSTTATEETVDADAPTGSVMSRGKPSRRKSAVLNPDNLESIMENDVRVKLVEHAQKVRASRSPSAASETFFEYSNEFTEKKEDFTNSVAPREDDFDLQEKIVGVLENRRGRQSFISFMKSNLKHDSFSFFQGAHVILMLDVDEVVEMAVNIAVEYMYSEKEENPENHRINAAEALKELKSPEEDVMLKVFRDLSIAQKEVIKMIVMGSLTKYILSSKEYKAWLDEEATLSPVYSGLSSRIMDFFPNESPVGSGPPSPEHYGDAQASNPIHKVKLLKGNVNHLMPKQASIKLPADVTTTSTLALMQEDSNKRKSRENQRESARVSAFKLLLQQQQMRFQRQQEVTDISEGNLTQKAVQNFEQGILDACLVGNKWLTSLIQCCEHLPLSMSLASASPSKPGFPLIYVNQNFMRIAGYEKSEILGRNCRFLQDHKVEKDSIQLMRTALREAKPVKVYITNITKDGKYFKNLLAMKPIFDQYGRYRYVLGCQFSLSNNELFNHSNFILLSQILKIFPDTIISCVDEEDGEM